MLTILKPFVKGETQIVGQGQSLKKELLPGFENKHLTFDHKKLLGKHIVSFMYI